jgi:hypothetical protein
MICTSFLDLLCPPSLSNSTNICETMGCYRLLYPGFYPHNLYLLGLTFVHIVCVQSIPHYLVLTSNVTTMCPHLLQLIVLRTSFTAILRLSYETLQCQSSPHVQLHVDRRAKHHRTRQHWSSPFYYISLGCYKTRGCDLIFY